MESVVERHVTCALESLELSIFPNRGYTGNVPKLRDSIRETQFDTVGAALSGPVAVSRLRKTEKRDSYLKVLGSFPVFFFLR